MTTQLPTVDTTIAIAAATLASTVLPSVHPLVVAGAQAGTEDAGTGFPGAVVARIAGHPTARIGLLVGDELVGALASSPTPGLRLAAAVQPAVDAVALTIGGTAEAAADVDPATLAAHLGGPFTVVPLIGAGAAAAVAVTNDVLVAVAAEPEQFSTATSAAAANAPIVAPAAVTHQPLTAAPQSGGAPRRGIEMLHGVDMELTVELGRTRMAVRDLLALAPGDVLELDRAAGSPADLLVNGRLIARGEVVVVDEDFGLRITQILDSNAG
ncbi:MAG: flagellar motor switch protein FliN [Marmoricola sp.]